MSPTYRFLTTLGLFLAIALTGSSKTKLHFLILTPFHSPDLSQLGWDGGPALVPAARLAAEQINRNDNILPDHELVLIEDYIYCLDLVEREVRFLDVYAKQLLYGDRNVLGVVGPACSVNAIHLAELSIPSRYPVVQVTIGTSPVLVNRTAFPFTFSTLSSGIQFLKAMKQLVDQQGWKSIGVIWDVTSTYYQALFAQIPNVFGNISISSFSVEDGDDFEKDSLRIEEKIIKSRLRIFIVLLSRNTADTFMCLAYKHSPQLIYEHAQWFFTERSTLLNPNSESKCSNSELEKAFEKTVFLQYQLSSNEHKPLNLSGQLYESFNQSYAAKVLAYERESGLNVTVEYPHGKPYAPVFYDAVWAFAKSLDRLIRTDKSNLTTLKELGRSDRLMLAQALQEAILGVDLFEGASGTIQFNEETGQTNTIITFTQVINGKLKLIGTSAGERINGTFIEDYFPTQYDRIEPWVASFVLIFIGWLFLLTLFLHISNVWYSKFPAIKATSPRLNNLIFIGCYLLILGMIQLTVINLLELGTSSHSYQLLGDFLCIIYLWLVEIGVVLVVATILMKTLRIYRIFVHFTKPGGFLLKDSALALCVLAILLPIIIGLLSTTIISSEPNSENRIWTKTNYLRTLNEHTQAICRVAIWQDLLPKLYVGSLLLISLLLSLRLRHINSNFRTIKSISILTFCQTLLTWIGYPLAFIASEIGVAWDQHIRYLVLIFILTGILLSCLLLLFVPPVAQVLKEKLNSKHFNLSSKLVTTSNDD